MKNEDVKQAVKEIQKKYGDDSLFFPDENSLEIELTPTGSIALDFALGGGIPKGRIVEIYGPESSGKTTIGLHMIKEVQRAGGAAAIVDAENALDLDYARSIGVDVDAMPISQPNSGEQALSITEDLVRSGVFSLVLVDSVAALVPKSEIDGEMGDANVGKQARLMSQAMRKLVAPANKNGCTIVFINQLREKVGVMFGNPETTTGGRALKFYSSVRMDVRKVETLKEKGEENPYANHVRVRIAKNKVAPPFKVAEFDIEFGKGISASSELFEMGTRFGVISKSGSFYSYGDFKVQGGANMKEALEADPQMAERVLCDLKEALNG